jgi:hypothetical protein
MKKTSFVRKISVLFSFGIVLCGFFVRAHADTGGFLRDIRLVTAEVMFVTFKKYLILILEPQLLRVVLVPLGKKLTISA